MAGDYPQAPSLRKLTLDLGGYENFSKELKNAGLTQFGSGWAWLVLKNDTLAIMKTSNADTPIAHGLLPLMTVDVWEHADYLDVFLHNLVNWEFVNSRLA